MRRNVVKRVPDICLFCALRNSIEPNLTSIRITRPARAYNSTASSWRPAGAAAARREEDDEDDYNPFRSNPSNHRSPLGRPRQGYAQSPPSGNQPSAPRSEGWKCSWGHTNAGHRSECTLCLTPKSRVPQPASRANPPTIPQNTPNARFGGGQRQGRDEFVQRQPMGSRGAGDFNTSAGQQSTWGSQPRSQYNGSSDRGFARADPQRSWSQRESPQHQRTAERPSNNASSRFGNLLDGLSSPSNRPRQGSNRPAPLGPDDKPTTFRPSFIAGDGLPPQHFNPLVKERPQASDTPPRSIPSRFPDYRRDQRGGRFAANDRQTVPASAARFDMFGRSDRETTPTPVDAAEDSSALPDPDDALPINDNDQDVFAERRRKAGALKDRRSRMYELEEDADEVVSTTSRAAVQPARAPEYRRNARRGQIDRDFDEAEAAFLGEARNRRNKKKSKQEEKKQTPQRPQLHVPEFISVEKLAHALKIKVDAFITKLGEEGFEDARYDHILDSGTSAMFAELYGFDPIVGESPLEDDLFPRPPAPDASILPPRPPIVTIMGHVDHGKTTILDWLRKSSVVASEHGGITQHIGAFSVTMPGTERQITFLDTPGHAAFLDMRKRGANVTDIVVLVVAADDSVKPQTIEAIKHALEAKVHIIVAINKIDKEDANIDRVKQDLSRHDISVEDYGGEYQAIPVSGKTGQGMEDLEEAIITLADVSDFRAETDGLAEGWVIESKVTPAGRVATVLIRRGTLHPGDFIVAGTTWGRVRTLRNDAGQLVSEAPPGTPVQVDGWRGSDPDAGLEVLQAETEDRAKRAIQYRLEQAEIAENADNMAAINAARSEEAEARAKVVAWRAEQTALKGGRKRRFNENEGWVEAVDQSGQKKVHFVIKADVAGSAEALEAAVSAIGNNEATANVIHTAVGQLSESDVQMLAATGEVGYAISFNQPIDGTIRRLAEAADLKILDHNIIYKVTDDVKEKVAAELPPLITYKVLGEAEIGQVFDVTIKKDKVKIAGCKITNGTVSRSNPVRVLRNGEVIYTGSLSSLKNVKKDVSEMRKGAECGMGFADWTDFEEGDQIQCYEEIREKKQLY